MSYLDCPFVLAGFEYFKSVRVVSAFLNPLRDIEPGMSTLSSGRFLNRRIAATYSKGVYFEPLREDKRGETIVARGTGKRETDSERPNEEKECNDTVW